MKLLLLEDDHTYNESIVEYLELIGFEVDSFFDGEDALDAIMENSYYLFLLDIKTPGIDGHTLIKYIKENKIETPIIILTSLIDIDNVSLGYELGCNDYLKKPFELKELELRIKELIKKHYHLEETGSVVSLGSEYTFDLIKNKLFKNQDEVLLSVKEKDLLSFLVSHKNIFLDLETIRENVWEGKEVTHADIRMCVRKIRLKTYSDFILSSRGLGYKIEA